MLDKLWDKTKEVLIIVEPGTPDGFDLVTDARAHLLSQDKDCHVAAPCPHSKVCLARYAIASACPRVSPNVRLQLRLRHGAHSHLLIFVLP